MAILENVLNTTGTSQSYDGNEHFTTVMKELLENKYWVTLDFGIEFIETVTDTAQFLLISEIFYPGGWEVTRDKKIYEVNKLIRGIVVDPGKNLYEMSFKPKDYMYGNIISKSTFILLITVSTFKSFKFLTSKAFILFWPILTLFGETWLPNKTKPFLFKCDDI